MDEYETKQHLKRLYEDLKENRQEQVLAQIEEQILRAQAEAYEKQKQLLDRLINYNEPCYRCSKSLTREQIIGQNDPHFRKYCSNCLLYTKICKRCGRLLDVKQFQKLASSRDKLRNTCLGCTSEKSRIDINDNLEKRLFTYGLTGDDYLKMYNNQSGLCAICQASDKLVIDHCHTTNKVRGLLCGKCNTALGLLKDNIEYFQRAIEYLKNKSI